MPARCTWVVSHINSYEELKRLLAFRGDREIARTSARNLEQRRRSKLILSRGQAPVLTMLSNLDRVHRLHEGLIHRHVPAEVAHLLFQSLGSQ